MSNFRNPLVAAVSLSVLHSAPSLAQDDGAMLELEQIVVTARKREESLQEVPVSISVLGDTMLQDTNILTQNDLFELIPGIYYDQGPDRNAAFPSVRGVQSNEIATNRTKVTSFVDGMPILGSQGALGFGNVAQVEVFRGPQSAAFGRSTFGGAINYVTRDPGDEFEGLVTADVNDYGRRLVRGQVSGPISDTVGFMLNAEFEDSSAPDDFIASDGFEYGTRATDQISGKLVFDPNENLHIEMTFSHTDITDGPTAQYFVSEAARDACLGQLGSRGIFNPAMMGGGVYIDGTFDCDWDQGAQIASQQDRSVVLAEAFDNPAYARQFPQYQNLTSEQQDDLLFLARSQSVFGDFEGAEDERDRFTLQLDWLAENGSAIQASFMTSEEFYIRGNDTSRDPDLPITFAPGMGVDWVLVDMGPMATLGTIMSDPTDIDETYAEVRWVSPADNRLRSVVGVSYYDYDFLTTLYFGGYGAIAAGPDAVARYLALTGDDVSVPDQLLGESATNVGVFFNASYDITGQATVTLEGRYQDDEVSGTDTISGNSGSVTTTKFIPRLSFNYNFNDATTFYAQYAEGNNPAGVNVGFYNPAIIASLTNANALWEATNGAEGAPYTVASVENFQEEELENLEFGFKGTALDGRFQYSTAIYFTEWRDNVVPQNLYWGPTLLPGEQAAPQDGNRTFLNAGDQDMQGIEFEGNLQITDRLRLRAVLGLLDAEYADFCDVGLFGALGPHAVATGRATFERGGEFGTPCYRVDGNELREQPNVTAAISPSYRADFGNTGLQWMARADIRWESGQWRDTANIGKTEDLLQINAFFGLSGELWDATLYINNLTDEDAPRNIAGNEDVSIIGRYLTIGNDPRSNFLVTPRLPRTVGFRMDYRF